MSVSIQVQSIKDSLIQPRNDCPAPFSARSRQALCKRSNRRSDRSTSNTHETEEVPQALGFRGVMCITKADPHMQGSTIPSRGNGGYEVCGDEFQERTGRYEVYSDEINSICLYSPKSTRNLRMRMIWEPEMITIIQLKHRCENIFYFPTDLSGAPKCREPLNLLHSSRFSAHHGVECNPTRTWITISN